MVVTLEVTEEASLPEEPGRPNSLSKDGREGFGGRAEERSGETGERNMVSLLVVQAVRNLYVTVDTK